jgi:hypothetical protein
MLLDWLTAPAAITAAALAAAQLATLRSPPTTTDGID